MRGTSIMNDRVLWFRSRAASPVDRWYAWNAAGERWFCNICDTHVSAGSGDLIEHGRAHRKEMGDIYYALKALLLAGEAAMAHELLAEWEREHAQTDLSGL